MNTAVERLRDRFSSAEFEQAINTASRLLIEHFSSVFLGQVPVQNWSLPEEKIKRALARLDEADRVPGENPHRITQLMKESLAGAQNLHHPHYIGHQVPGPLPLAGVFDAIGSITNQVMAVYEMGPWATAMERALIIRMGEVLGFREGEFAGLVTSGGSIANLTALLTARNVAHPAYWTAGASRSSPPPVILVQQDAHYCIARAVGVLGMGTHQIVRIGLDAKRRMCPHALGQSLHDLHASGTPVTAVVACACATPIGAFDPLPEIADLCERYGVWLHVDAAHGAAAAFSKKHRGLVAGIERADSVVCDAHKMMHVPALCAFLIYKNKLHRFAAFQQDAPYLFDPSAPGMAEYDSGLMTLECTKRAAAFGVWGVWSTYGRQFFSDVVEVTFGLAQEVWSLIRQSEDFEIPYEPQCNIIVFRRTLPGLDLAELNAMNREIRRKLVESGEFYISQTTIEGEAFLRMTVINPLTTLAHVSQLLDRIRSL